MPFEIAHPVRPLTPRFTEQQAWVQYPPDPVRRYENPMFGWAVAFYVTFAVTTLGWLPTPVGGVLGVVFFLRYLNRFHQALHADDRRAARWHPARVFLVLVGPLYLGYRELREIHHLHHREEGSARDPDLLMMQRSALRSLFWCFFQPELSVVDYIQRFGLRPRLIAGLTARAAVYVALMTAVGWEGFLLFNITVRVANTIAWMVFSWFVHAPWLWGQVRPPRFPLLIAHLWTIVVGWENLVGIRFHFLHHVFPHIPDRHLPEVSRRMII
ncbi:MAG: fatty acid desaturase [Myxococcales bacterium]|nr:fatty acid desaturase [Myxococcales bacterium]